jgi:hypothetical protein
MPKHHLFLPPLARVVLDGVLRPGLVDHGAVPPVLRVTLPPERPRVRHVQVWPGRWPGLLPYLYTSQSALMPPCVVTTKIVVQPEVWEKDVVRKPGKTSSKTTKKQRKFVFEPKIRTQKLQSDWGLVVKQCRSLDEGYISLYFFV